MGGRGGLGSDFEHHHHVVHMGLGRARWHGTQGLPPPFRRPLCPSSRVGFAPIPTKSGASRASGLICGSWERCRPGPASAASRSLQKIVVAIVGAASRAGRERLRGSSPPDSTERALVVHFPRRAGEGLRAPVAMVVSPRPERAGQADQDGRPSGAALPSIDLSVVRGVGSSTVVPGSVGSYRPVIAGAKLREGTTTILPRGRALQGVGLSSMRFHPIGGGPKTTKMDKKHGSRQESHPLLDRPEIGWPFRTRISCHHLVWTAH